jgi:rhamnulokinase
MVLMKKHIAVDIGASSGRLVVGMKDQERIYLKEIYRFENEIEERSGHYFWNIENIFQEILKGLMAAKQAGIEDCTLGIDTWGVDYVLIDGEGNRIQEVYAYRDERTKMAIQNLQQEKSLEEIYQKIGIQFLSFNTLFQLYVHDKAELAKAHKILLVPDYLYYRLSGRIISEKTNASTTQLLNVVTKDYDEELLKLIGVKREQFAALTEPGESLGAILESVRAQYDLPRCELICAASHDTASAILGVPGFSEHFAYLCSGTWSLLGVENKMPLANEQSYAKNYSNEWGAYGTYRFLKNIMGLWLIQEVRRNLGKEHSFADFVTEARAITPFQFLIDCNHNCFLKPKNMIKEIQDFCQATGQSIPKTAGELARCIFDSLALLYRKVLEEIAALNGYTIDALHVVGGGVQNELLCQLTADVTKVPVFAGPIESTALGNIVVQMICCGELKNVEEARKMIMESFRIKSYQPIVSENLEDAYIKFNQVLSISNRR